MALEVDLPKVQGESRITNMNVTGSLDGVNIEHNNSDVANGEHLGQQVSNAACSCETK